jgi:hypothetical protein
MDVNGTLRARNELNIGPTSEQNFFVNAGTSSDTDRYIKAGYYGQGNYLYPGKVGSGAASTGIKRTTAAFSSTGKVLEDLRFVVVKMNPNAWLNMVGDSTSKPPKKLVDAFGSNTLINPEHIAFFKTQGTTSFSSTGTNGSEQAWQVNMYENESTFAQTGNFPRLWTAPAAVTNVSSIVMYNRPCWVQQGTEYTINLPYNILNNQSQRTMNRSLYVRTVTNATVNPTAAIFYIRVAYRVYRREQDFVNATSITYGS